MKVLKIEYEGLKHFENGHLTIDLYAADRVSQNNDLHKVAGNIYVQNIIGLIGLNATGKTTVLRLLKMALDVMINNVDLNTTEAPEMIGDGTIMRVTFHLDGKYYQLESTIITIEDTSGRQKFCYGEEVLRGRNSRVQARADLNRFETEIKRRSKLDAEAKMYLEDGKSIVSATVKGNGQCVTGLLWQSYLNLPLIDQKVPTEILNVFDESIEMLSMEMPTKTGAPLRWSLRFKGEDEIYENTDPLAMNRLISTGTIKGQELMRQIVYTLRKGGYMLVDELEMHLNKELVRIILGLFQSPKTNPNGGCLIFSTHYPEILDSFDRKDNIYITRKSERQMTVRKFSDEFHRNDFKKSDIIISNALKGTAPKYETIQRLRDYVCRSI